MAKTVVCAIEVGEAMHQVVRLARQEAVLHSAELHLLNVQIIPVFATAGGASAPVPQVVADKSTKAQKALEALANIDNGEQVHVRMAESSIGETIAHYAQKHDAVRIVVGNRDRSDLSKFLLGSVTQQVLRVSTVPVVVAPVLADG